MSSSKGNTTQLTPCRRCHCGQGLPPGGAERFVRPRVAHDSLALGCNWGLQLRHKASTLAPLIDTGNAGKGCRQGAPKGLFVRGVLVPVATGVLLPHHSASTQDPLANVLTTECGHLRAAADFHEDAGFCLNQTITDECYDDCSPIKLAAQGESTGRQRDTLSSS